MNIKGYAIPLSAIEEYIDACKHNQHTCTEASYRQQREAHIKVIKILGVLPESPDYDAGLKTVDRCRCYGVNIAQLKRNIYNASCFKHVSIVLKRMESFDLISRETSIGLLSRCRGDMLYQVILEILEILDKFQYEAIKS